MRANSVFKKVSDLLFPPLCPVCGAKCMKDGAVCEECFNRYSAEELTPCPVCGATPERCACGAELFTDEPLGGKYALFLTFYLGPEVRSGATEKMILRFKERYDKALTDFFARELSGKLLTLMKLSREDPAEWFITYPPRSSPNLRKYGFDQSEAAVRSISRDTGIPWGKTLFRTESAKQKGLGKSERRKNASSIVLLDRAHVTGKKIILFDDIITTGATVGQSAELLKAAGAERVFPVCIARTPPRKRTSR